MLSKAHAPVGRFFPQIGRQKISANSAAGIYNPPKIIMKIVIERSATSLRPTQTLRNGAQASRGNARTPAESDLNTKVAEAIINGFAVVFRSERVIDIN